MDTPADRMLRRFLARQSRRYLTDDGRRELDAERPGAIVPVAVPPTPPPLTRAQMLAAIDADYANQVRFRAAVRRQRSAA